MNFLLCLVSFMINSLVAKGVHIVWDNNAIYDPEAGEEIGRSDEARMPNWFFIFPGTSFSIIIHIVKQRESY